MCEVSYPVRNFFTPDLTGAIKIRGFHMKLSIDFFLFLVAGHTWQISPVGALHCCGAEREEPRRLSGGRGVGSEVERCSRSHQ